MPSIDMSTLRRIPPSLMASYIPDWIIISGCTLVWLFMGISTPHYQAFSVDDKRLSFPYTPPSEQTVTVPMLFMTTVAMPSIIIVLFSLLYYRNTHDCHVGLLGLLLTISLTLMFTNGLKNVLGRPRPDMLSRCFPTLPEETVSDPEMGLSTVKVCTQKDMRVLNEGFRSFPSGHTSLSFGSLGYLTLFLAGKLHLFDRQGRSLKSFVVFSPLLVATTVGASRVSDYWHHPTDVFCGAALGIFTALFAYHQYYPILISQNCHKPFDPRKPPTPLLPISGFDQDTGHDDIHLSPTSSSPSIQNS